MNQPSKHADLLNSLDEIQRSPAIAVHREVLRRAEWVIVEQEQELAMYKTLHASLKSLNESLASRVAAQSELLTRRSEKGPTT